MLRDDPAVAWPDAVTPGTDAARALLEAGKAREAAIDRRREAAMAARRETED